jgi:hypothetical protein
MATQRQNSCRKRVKVDGLSANELLDVLSREGYIVVRTCGQRKRKYVAARPGLYCSKSCGNKAKKIRDYFKMSGAA